MAPHSSTLAWKIPWMEEPGRLQSMGSLRVGHDWATSLSFFTFMHWRRKWQPTPVFLPGESQGRGSLVGCRLWGRTESDTTEVTQQQLQQSSINHCCCSPYSYKQKGFTHPFSQCHGKQNKPWSRSPHNPRTQPPKILGTVLGLCLESWKEERSGGEMDTQNKRRACPRGSQFCLLSLSYKKNLRLLENIFKSLEEKFKKEYSLTYENYIKL